MRPLDASQASIPQEASGSGTNAADSTDSSSSTAASGGSDSGASGSTVVSVDGAGGEAVSLDGPSADAVSLDGAGADGGATDGTLAQTATTDGSTADDSTGDGSTADATIAASASDGSVGCTPGATQCSDAGVRTCETDGQWGGPVACPMGLPFCNEAGVCGVCSGGATQCSSGNSVQTCGSDGAWSTPWSCATGTCTAGACAGSTTFGPSCLPGGPGMDNCGPGGVGTESCCTSLEVPGGTYERTYDVGPCKPLDGGPPCQANPATVSGFRLDKYLVTVGRFRQYLNDLTGSIGAPPANGSGIHANLNGGRGLANGGSTGTYETGWDATDWNANIVSGPGAASVWNTILACDPNFATWTPVSGGQETLPINCVDWYQAYAFCIWDGGFLPSQAEWEYTAAGGNLQRPYPWGSSDPLSDDDYAIRGCDYQSNLNICTGVANIAPVGTAKLGAGDWGQLDMLGELLEWNLDWEPDSVDIVRVNPCIDCANLSKNSLDLRVVVGCPFDSSGSGCGIQGSAEQVGGAGGGVDLGFRCARTP